jgi:hypothetical protein
MLSKSQTARDVALLTLPREAAQRARRSKDLHLLRVVAVFIQIMRNVTAHRTVADLGEYQLRDIGLWRVDCSRPLGCPQVGVGVYGAGGRLGLF